MALLSLQAIALSGLGPVYGAASAGGDTIQIPGSGSVFAHVKNGAASAVTVTIPTVNNVVDGHTIADITVSIPASSERMIGPIPAKYHANNVGQATLNYSASASVTLAALRI